MKKIKDGDLRTNCKLFIVPIDNTLIQWLGMEK